MVASNPAASKPIPLWVLLDEGEFTTLSRKGCETVNAGLQVLQLDHPHRR